MTKKFMNRRKELGLTQKQIADAVGVTVQTVSNWETGLYQPKLTLHQTAKLSQVLGLGVNELALMFDSEKKD